MSHLKREFNGFHIHSTLITVIITKIILHGNKALSQVVDENTKKARKVPYARGKPIFFCRHVIEQTEVTTEFIKIRVK